MKIYKIHASWDDEARVWYVESSDIPGLVAEAPTQAEFERKVMAMVPELLELNGVLECDDHRDVPLELIMSQRLTARLGC